MTNSSTIQLQYLPDFSEEYAIDVRAGLGKANVQINLADGWNLTSINQDLDSQTDENLAAAANLAGAVLPGLASGGGDGKPESRGFKVAASNVPLGYYESVVGADSCGRKRLYGFRYVGFMPFQGCPLEMGGALPDCCETSPIYGLVFEDGVMRFKALGEIGANLDPTRVSDIDIRRTISTTRKTDSSGMITEDVTETVHQLLDK